MEKIVDKGFLYTKRGRGVADCCKLLGARILCSCSRPLGQVRRLLLASNKANVILCSATFYLYMNGKGLHL